MGTRERDKEEKEVANWIRCKHSVSQRNGLGAVHSLCLWFGNGFKIDGIAGNDDLPAAF